MSQTLVIAPSWVGDIVMAQPLCERLAAASASGTVDVLAPAFAAPLLKRMPGVGAVIDNPFPHRALDLAGRRRLGRSLAQRGYARAVVLPNSFKSALLPWFAGIPNRTGYRRELRSLLLDDARQSPGQEQPRLVDRFAQLAEPADAPPVHVAPPRLLDDAQVRAKTLAALGLSLDRPVAALCPGAEYGPAKRWPAAHFRALATALVGEGWHVWLLGSARERDIAVEIAGGLGDACENLCGRTDLGQAVDLLAAAGVVVSNDSGLMHVAAALHRPLVAVFGSSSPTATPPLSDMARIEYLGLSCSPCFERKCPLGHLDCLTRIDPARVLTSIHTLLAAR